MSKKREVLLWTLVVVAFIGWIAIAVVPHLILLWRQVLSVETL